MATTNAADSDSQLINRLKYTHRNTIKQRANSLKTDTDTSNLIQHN